MLEQNANKSDLELEILDDLSNEVHFTSNFRFLRAHNGWRPGKLHVIMGDAGIGKSSLLRGLIIDALEQGDNAPKIGMWLSEETYLDFLTELNKTRYKRNLSNLFVQSELDALDEIKLPELKKYFVDWIKQNDLDLIFFDNLTTSNLYSNLSVDNQGELVKWMKKIAQRKNIPFVMVVHTGASVYRNMNRLIEMNDIRGAKHPVNLAEFFYVLQSFENQGDIQVSIRTTKYRGQECLDRLHHLLYSQKGRIYAGDNRLNFETFKEFFKNRDKL